MRVHGRDEFEIKGQTGVIGLQHQPVAAKPFKNFDTQRPDSGREGIGSKAPGRAEIVLFSVDRDAGKSVHDVAVGVPAEPDVEDHIAGRLWMSGIPEPLHPARIAAHDVVERGRQLMADEVVLFGKHVSPPCQAPFSDPREISSNIGFALVVSSHFNCRLR